jgi:cyclic beta-1,2-glucan synthetase
MTVRVEAPPARREPLRGEILGLDALGAHARELALAHADAAPRGPLRPLLDEFRRTRDTLLAAYRTIEAAARARHDPVPAEEWLLDNFHTVDEQLREIVEDLPRGYLIQLPRLRDGPQAGYPRVYLLARDFVVHTDAHVDPESLLRYLLAYQEIAPLTIGELWAVAIMLRLALVENICALTEQEVAARAERAAANRWADQLLGRTRRRPADGVVALAELATSGQALTDGFVVQLLKRLRDEDLAMGPAFAWIDERLIEMGTSADETIRRERHRQAINQVSVGNSITSMRVIGAIDWAAFFSETSVVERELRRDPAGAYAAMDAASLDQYRHEVERLAARSGVDEPDVARLAVAQAAAETGTDAAAARRRHVGYALLDEGRPALERTLGYRLTRADAWRRAVLTHSLAAYFSAIALVLAVLVAIPCVLAWRSGVAPSSIALMILLLLLPASEMAISVVNLGFTRWLKPRSLPKLTLVDGIPAAYRTVVVVPTLLTNAAAVRKLVADLEIRYLANADPSLHFALLTDFPDAAQAEEPGDVALLALAQAELRDLARRHAGGSDERFYLLHRERRWNASQGVWMGWERKRGKLEEFNRLLRGATDTSFTFTVGDLSVLRDVRYVITLDADTGLPRDAARELIGTIAHPLNRAVFDARRGRVVAGYGIIQPRVSTNLVSAGRSLFARIFTGNTGLDPYTTAISDVYQDLFREGSYYGKGIYDVDAFRAALAGRVPENRLLSHDLFEGLFARAGLASDVELLDEYPSHYVVYAGRQHRWVRGDWQLLPWLLPTVAGVGGRRPNDVPALGRWKLFDNLRRSLLPPAVVGLLVAGWTVLPGPAAAWTIVALSALAFPILGHLTTTVLQATDTAWTSYLRGFWGDLGNTALRVLLTIVFLLDQAVLTLGAIVRTLVRLLLTHRKLLEWETASEAERRVARGLGAVLRRMWLSVALGFAIFFLVASVRPSALPLALPLLFVWLWAPAVAEWIGRPIPPRVWRLAGNDLALLRQAARKTWRFFETFVTEADHWLPPDNYQQDPKGVIAHRTSPTNVGLYLLAVLAARDFGYVTLRDLTERLAQTLGTLEEMEHYRGHLYNWYDTTDLRPLPPLYVSTVDSGNLVGHLIALQQGCHEVLHTPIVGPPVLAALRDLLELWQAALTAEARSPDGRPASEKAVANFRTAVVRATTAPPVDLVGWRLLLDDLLAHLEPFSSNGEAARPAPPRPSDDAAYWSERLHFLLRSTRDELDCLAPWARLLGRANGPAADGAAVAGPAAVLAALAGARSVADLPARCAEAGAALGASDAAERAEVVALRAALHESSERATELLARLATLGEQAARLADETDFSLVYDASRHLFSIGFNAATSTLDNSHYDLLASEARLASLIAIARDVIPQAHWFRLGRQLAPAANGRALVSWSGTMFEYLMPLLVMRTYPETLLDETYHAVVARQIEYAAHRGVPWGTSESAYNTLDLALNYQYRAFGVPGLGLKPGLGDDQVVAPYATVLALPVNPSAALDNLRTLAREGMDGRYGFYESIDYTATRVPPGRRAVIVRCFMAHHQGMSLVALDNVVHGDPMVRRFHTDPRVRATELLLQERVPGAVALFDVRHEDTLHQAAGITDEGPVDRVGHLGGPIPSTMLLSNGTYSTLVSAAGAGWSTYRGLAVTRWREDTTLDRGGMYCYVRDRENGRVWSTTYQPTRVPPDAYQVTYSPDAARFRRQDGAVETLTEVVLSPEANVEVRRVTLTNLGETPLQLELTSYAEIALNAPAADLAHPAFGNLFVETEFVAELGTLLCTRRPRSPDETPAWLAHVTAAEGQPAPVAEYETSRLRFLGRNRDPAAPAALDAGAALSNTAGAVLDPALALRRQVTLAPGERVVVSFVLAGADSREAAIELAERFGDPRAVTRTFELAWTDARVELRHLNLTAQQAHQFQDLAASLLFNDRDRRAPPDVIARNTRQQPHLWSYGISGDRPIVVVRVDDPESTDLVQTLLLAHEYWRLNTLSVDLVIFNEDPGGYLQPLQDALLAMVRSSPAQGHLSQPGGVFVLRADLLPEDDRTLLLAVARVVLQTSRGRLGRQLVRHRPTGAPPIAASPAGREPATAPSGPVTTLPPLERQYFNERGGFSPDGGEYVIDLPPGEATPAPWINVIANADFGFLVSESGAGFTWQGNSQANRLTPWSNDPISDPAGEAVYLRDEADGRVWSPTPAPSPSGAAYRVRHSQGWTRFEHRAHDIETELTVFVAVDAPVKVRLLRLHNLGAEPRRLTATCYVEWVLGTVRERTAPTVVTQHDPVTGALFARNAYADPAVRVAFLAASEPVQGYTADRTEFLGRDGSRAFPAALDRGGLTGAAGAAFDPCGVLQVAVDLRPGETREVVFLLGEAPDPAQAGSLIQAYTGVAAARAALDAVGGHWAERLGSVQVHTPNPALDLLTNRWLPYQALACRFWARSAFYQSGGAFGFRDQLQDVLAFLPSAPGLAREHLLRAAARQFREGDVQHWWHADSGQGVRTRCSDDLLWLPYVAAAYVAATSDAAILDEVVPFLEARPLEPKEHDVLSVPAVSNEIASLYEHCARALDRGTTAGPHGLPLIGDGDWNDGMNRVGHEGRGESVWLAWFLARTLLDFVPLAEARGDHARVERCRAEASRLAEAVDTHAWDGAWYRRAYYDDGTPLGSAQGEECTIDAIAQSWSVLAGVGQPERAREAMRSGEQYLLRPDDGLLLLLAPPFDKGLHDPGYIKGYVPGVRENGGQYTHGVLWTVWATARLGDGDQAMALFDLLNPIHHARTPADIERYRVEPYVVAADVYAAADHRGRGGWTWYTGSAGWMYRLAVEAILGFRLLGDCFRVDPAIPCDWSGFTLEYRRGETRYAVSVENPSGAGHGVQRVELDGVALSGPDVPLVLDGAVHQVRVTLGPAERGAAAPQAPVG